MYVTSVELGKDKVIFVPYILNCNFVSWLIFVNRCDVCNGHGRVKCWTCMGNAQLKTFIELTVKW